MRPKRSLLTLSLAALVAAAGAAPAAAELLYRYPMKGKHTYGNLDVTGFGAKRADGTIHTGQDIVADCGTSIVATHAAKVRSAGYSTGYGFYVVLRGAGSQFDFVYGHMKGRSRVSAGKTVSAGRQLGSVGRTGSDSGVCHLHFELWKGRWFAGGRRVDPLPRLRAWDKRSGGPLVEEPQPPDDQPFASERLYYDSG